jgi:hypothetical protein
MLGPTPLQRTLIERLSFVGMEDFADRAMLAWGESRPYPCALTPAERATMEGAQLCEEFKQADQQARAAWAELTALPSRAQTPRDQRAS